VARNLKAQGFCGPRQLTIRLLTKPTPMSPCFCPKRILHFFEMLSEACAVLVKSIDKGWYDSSTGPAKKDDIKQPQATRDTKSKTDGDFMDGDDVVIVD
jgi:hypothetical protein